MVSPDYPRLPDYKGVFFKLVQRGIATIIKNVNVSSSAAKGESRGVIEDKARFLERERDFLFRGNRADFKMWHCKQDTCLRVDSDAQIHSV